MHYLLLLYIIAFVSVSAVNLAIIVNMRNDRSGRDYLMYSLSIMLWIFFDTLMAAINTNLSSETALILTKIKVVFWGSVGFLFLKFIYSFTQTKRGALFIVSASMASVAILLGIFTPYVIESVEVYSWGVYSVIGKIYFPIMFGCVALPSGYALKLCYDAISRKDNSIIRKQAKYVFIGSAAMYAFALAYEVKMAILTIQESFPRLTVLSVLIQSIFIFIAIKKYRFLTVDSQEDKYVAESIKDGVIITDENLKIVHANNVSRSIFSYNEDKLEDSFIYDFIADFKKDKNTQNAEFVKDNEKYLISQFSLSMEKNKKLFLIKNITHEQNLLAQIKTSEKYIEAQSKYDRLRAKIWQIASDPLLSEESIIQSLLNEAGPILDIDRATYNKINESKNEYIATLEWTNEGISSSINTSIPKMLVDPFIHNKYIEIKPEEAIAKMPLPLRPIAAPIIRGLAKKFDISSFFALSITLGGKVIALLTFDVCSGKNHLAGWSSDKESIMHDMAEIITQVVSRKQTERELRKREADLKEKARYDTLRVDMWKIGSNPFLTEEQLVQSILNKAGEILNISRICYNPPSKDGKQIVTTIEWTNEGVSSSLGGAFPKFILDYLPENNIIEFTPESARKFFPSPIMRTMEPIIKKLMEEFNLTSMLAVPYHIHNEREGIVSFEMCEESNRDWSENIKSVAMDIAYLISQCVSRIRTQTALAESEMKIQEIAQTLPEVIFELDLHGNISFINDFGLHLFGITEENIKHGYSIFSLIPDEETGAFKSWFIDIISGKEPSGREYILSGKDGTRFYAAIHATAIVRFGKAIGIRGFAIDMSLLKETQQVLSESETRFKETVELLPSIVCEVDKDFNISYVNRQGLETFGYTREDFENGINLRSLFDKEEFALVKRNYAEIASGKVRGGSEYKAKRKDGSSLTVLIRSTPIIRNGEFVGLRSSLTDISERKEIEEELRLRTEELEIVNSIIKICNNTTELKTSINEILSTTISVSNFQAGGVYFIEKQTRKARLVYFHGIDEDKYDDLAELEIDVPPYRTVFNEKKPLQMSTNTPVKLTYRFTYFKSVLMLPLFSNDNVFGALFIAGGNENSFGLYEVNLLSTIAGEMGSMISKNLSEEYTKTIEKDLSKKQESIKAAQELQQHLNTNGLPRLKNYNTAAYYMPSEELGGDLFIYENIGDKIIMVIADCVGHGLKASLSSTLLKSICDRHLSYLSEGATDFFLMRVNREVIEYFYGRDYPTMFAGVIDTETNILTYSHANSPRPYVIGKNGVVMLDKAKGAILGFDKETTYEIKTRKIENGDKIFLYSDAVMGVLIDNDIVYDVENLEEALSKMDKSITEDVAMLFDDLAKHSTLPLEDDTTILMCQRVDEIIEEFEITFLEEGIPISERIDNYLKKMGYDEDDRSAIAVSFEEMYVNAIEHGNKGDKTKRVLIHYILNCDHIMITIRDEGEGFNPEDIPDPTAHEKVMAFLSGNGNEGYVGGRGIWIVHKVMDSVAYNEKGNEVTITKVKRRAQTAFMYFAPSEELKNINISTGETDSGENNVVVWVENLDIDSVLENATGEVLVLDFHHLQTLSSYDVSQLLSLIKRAGERHLRVCLMIPNDRLFTLLKDLDVTAFEHVSVV